MTVTFCCMGCRFYFLLGITGGTAFDLVSKRVTPYRKHLMAKVVPFPCSVHSGTDTFPMPHTDFRSE